MQGLQWTKEFFISSSYCDGWYVSCNRNGCWWEFNGGDDLFDVIFACQEHEYEAHS